MDYREKFTPTPLNSKDFFHNISKMVALLKQVKLHLLNSGSKKKKKKPKKSLFISRQNFLKKKCMSKSIEYE